MKVTKKLIDDTTAHYLKMQEAKRAYEKADKVWKDAMAPITKYVEETLNLPADHAAELKGHHSVLKIGKQRAVESLSNPVDALRLLEHKEKGLGYANITIKLEVLRDNLALPDYEHLLETTYGKRIVKAVDLD